MLPRHFPHQLLYLTQYQMENCIQDNKLFIIH
jgi:hypothetical protein